MDRYEALMYSTDAYLAYCSDWNSEVSPEESYKKFAIEDYLQNVRDWVSSAPKWMDDDKRVDALDKAIRVVGLFREYDGAISYLLMCFAVDPDDENLRQSAPVNFPKFSPVGMAFTETYHEWIDHRGSLSRTSEISSTVLASSFDPYNDALVTMDFADEFITLSWHLEQLVRDVAVPKTSVEGFSLEPIFSRDGLRNIAATSIFQNSQSDLLDSAMDYVVSFNRQVASQNTVESIAKAIRDLGVTQRDSEFLKD